jgi:hypothetical protein
MPSLRLQANPPDIYGSRAFRVLNDIKLNLSAGDQFIWLETATKCRNVYVNVPIRVSADESVSIFFTKPYHFAGTPT